MNHSFKSTEKSDKKQAPHLLQLADRRWSRSIEDSSISWNVLLSISRQKLLAQAGCALPVTTPQSKCGHFAWFTWQFKMNAKVEDLTWRFVILYGFPEPVRFQSAYFSNCILSFTNSVNAQTSCSWYMQNRWRHLFICVSTGFNLFIAVTWIVVLTNEIL